LELRTGPFSQSETHQQVYFAEAADRSPRTDQDRSQQAGRALSVAHQDLAGGKGGRAL